MEASFFKEKSAKLDIKLFREKKRLKFDNMSTRAKVMQLKLKCPKTK
jgi:hypothetical protein